MNRWILILLLLLGHVATLRAEPFNQAEVTKTINLVFALTAARTSGARRSY
jgi:hypothetical protein